MARRDRQQEKKRRRLKRLAKKGRGELQGAVGDSERLAQAFHPVFEGPQPGACDHSTCRPDRIKYELASFACYKLPGRQKCDDFERRLKRGPLGFLPSIDHWAIEEFLWHGVPGDPWHPVEAYLEQYSSAYSPEGGRQIARWQEAELGIFEIGAVCGYVLGLQAWDPVQGRVAGPAVRAILLSIGGVQSFRQDQGKLLLTYLAPWALADDLFCGMGYSSLCLKTQAALLLPYLGLRQPGIAARVLPWKESPQAAADYLTVWRSRDWQRWLREQMEFPFQALVQVGPQADPEICRVEELLPTTPEQARAMGIYFNVPDRDEPLLAGGTAVTPLDVMSKNGLALLEYHAYRQRVGPPPGMRGRPSLFRFLRTPGTISL